MNGSAEVVIAVWCVPHHISPPEGKGVHKIPMGMVFDCMGEFSTQLILNLLGLDQVAEAGDLPK